MSDAQLAEGLLPLGTPAPEFKMVAGTGEDVELTQFRGKKVVLCFYTFDFTGG